MTSHANCDHPSTKAARTACRKLQATVGPPRVDQATSEKRRAAAKTFEDQLYCIEFCPIDHTHKPLPKRTKKAQRAASNTKRTEATRRTHPQRPTSDRCWECGSKAGWVSTQRGPGKGKPVCIKHVDYDKCTILPL